MTWYLVGLFAFIVIYNLYRYRQEDDRDEYIPEAAMKTENRQVAEQKMKEVIGTRQLALNAIESIGSKPEYTEDGMIRFEYQGIIFLMEATRECKFVNLIWPFFYTFSKFDVDEFSRGRQAINDINSHAVVSAFYVFTDSDEVAVHLIKHFLFIPQIPDLDVYLKDFLYNFFVTARNMNLEIEKSRLQECGQAD